ncbi:MAG TPA: cellulose biosynthesis protein BcsD [Phenylobacterium sp.]|nr:cellulose biosynthesis protein BcsD [Phenylobacterium sp.]
MSRPPILAPDEIERLDQAYLAARRCEPQWRDFLGALAVELHANAEPDEVLAFLRAVGRRIGEKRQLVPSETLQELEAAINRVWSDMDWGWARLVAVETGIAIVHGAYPNAFEDDEHALWPPGAAAVLEGVYSVWFKAQGSPLPNLRRITQSISPLVFLHGR